MVNYQTSWTKGITLNTEAGTLLSVFEQGRSLQFHLTCLEGSSLFEPCVAAYTSKCVFEQESRAINQHSFAPIQSELAQKDPYKQNV